jgi:type II secretory pathway pseudopilin PulG
LKRYLIAALAVISIMSIMASPVSASWRRQEIRYQSSQRASWTQREVTRTIRAAVARWHVPGGARKALAVARCESGLNEDIHNGICCGGVFQQHTSYWPGRQNHYDSRRWRLAESWRNARANIIVSIRMVHSGGWSPWACA